MNGNRSLEELSATLLFLYDGRVAMYLLEDVLKGTPGNGGGGEAHRLGRVVIQVGPSSGSHRDANPVSSRHSQRLFAQI